MPNNAFGLRVLTDLSTQMKDVDSKFRAAIRKELRAGIALAGFPVLEKVKRNAGWSSRIPNATKLSIRYSTNGASVKIVTDAKKAPHARPYDSPKGAFRHPVFGNRQVWVAEKSRPFFMVAVKESAPGIDVAMEKIVVKTARDAGFK